jgi:hypothetical protein
VKSRLHHWLAAFTLSAPTVCAAITIDAPGFEYAAVASTMHTDNAMVSNLLSADTALTDLMVTSYAFSRDVPASVRFTFSDGANPGVAITGGDGIDLSIFFVGKGGHHVTLSLFDETTLLGSHAYNHQDYIGWCIDDGSGACEPDSKTDLPIFVMNIDFADYGLVAPRIDNILLDISGASAVPSLVGASYLAPAVSAIPLPAAIWLMISGSALLGLVARRH